MTKPTTLALVWSVLLVACSDPERSASTDDAGAADSTSPIDSGKADTGLVDSSTPSDADAGRDSTVDSSAPDSGTLDTGTLDTGPADTGLVDTGPVDTGIKPLACKTGSTETFSAKMIGCTGVLTFPNRATACPAGSHVCSAKEWVDNHGSLAPKHHYWTNDPLKYEGSGPSACSVSLTTGSDCGAETPMRVCTGTGTAAVTDPEGNVCNWVACGYGALTPNQYFGGCAGNTTAGTLCCAG